MNAFEPSANSDDERRWRVSGRSAGLGVRAWMFALAVVAAMTVGLFLLHG